MEGKTDLRRSEAEAVREERGRARGRGRRRRRGNAVGRGTGGGGGGAAVVLLGRDLRNQRFLQLFPCTRHFALQREKKKVILKGNFVRNWNYKTSIVGGVCGYIIIIQRKRKLKRAEFEAREKER